MESDLLKVGDVIERSGLSRQIVYQYLNLGFIHETAKTEGGQRLFSPEVVERARIIRALNQSGYTLQQIRETFGEKLRQG